MPDIKMVNKMEVMVKYSIEENFRLNRKICQCERCRMDVMALALNTLPPRYVVTDFGEVMTQFEVQSSQWRADVMVAVIKAMELVKKKPRH